MKARKVFVPVLLLAFLVSHLGAQTNLPSLGIGMTNGNVTLSWPMNAYYWALTSSDESTNPVGGWNWVCSGAKVQSFYQDGSSPVNYYDGPYATNNGSDELSYTLPATNSQQFFRLKPLTGIPLFQFAIFYDGLLEFSTAATLNINGPVHANGPIYTGSGSPLTLYDTVTTAADISSPTNAGSGPPWAYTGVYLGNPGNVTNTLLLRPDLGTNDLHSIIEMPPPGEDPESQLGRQRYYNKAGVVLLVSNTTATVLIKSSPMDTPITIAVSTFGTNSVALRNNFPFLSITNRFGERREAYKTNYLTQIDIGVYNLWLLTNVFVSAKFPPSSSAWPNILYVADNRTPSSNLMYSVRLTNGVAIPTNGNTGFTLATRNPLYVWGDYNCPISEKLGTSNTTGTQPASFACDALTVLSRNWTDSSSYQPYSPSSPIFDASNITVNAAIITGNVPSTGITTTKFSGGLHNLVRLLEDWTSKTNTLNTSVACLFGSTIATNKFIFPGTTYNPPTRRWNYDQNFMDFTKLPPGTPFVGVVDK